VLGVLNAVGVAVGAHQRNANRLGLTSGAVVMVCLLGRSGGVVRVVAVEYGSQPDLDVPAGHVDVFDERA
jgi:8-oxo-dGTP pyrophosphatase MutT (NUDIX family)